MSKPAPDIKVLQRWMVTRFSRSSGPGGQNVNKVNTRVTVFFDFEACVELTETHKARIRKRFRTRLSRDGRLKVVRHRERTQARNRQEAEMQILDLLAQVMRRNKVRKATRPTPASKRRRLTDKRHHGQLKQQRRISTEE